MNREKVQGWVVCVHYATLLQQSRAQGLQEMSHKYREHKQERKHDFSALLADTSNYPVSQIFIRKVHYTFPCLVVLFSPKLKCFQPLHIPFDFSFSLENNLILHANQVSDSFSHSHTHYHLVELFYKYIIIARLRTQHATRHTHLHISISALDSLSNLIRHSYNSSIYFYLQDMYPPPIPTNPATFNSQYCLP